MKLINLMAGALLTAALVACGGGGGSPGSTGGATSPVTNTPTTPITVPSATPASIDVQASANELLSSGAEVTVTVAVKSATNVGMADQTVTFEVDNRATLKGPSAKTNADGVATVRLSAGAKDNRLVTVTVKAGTASGQISLPVVGTRLAITGPVSVKAGIAQPYTARLVDSAGLPISGATLSAASVLAGNVVGPISATDATGQATFNYNANVGGTDTLTVSGFGAGAQLPITISGEDFTFDTPGAGTEVNVGSTQSITVRYFKDGVAVPGAAISFTTTRGVLSSASGITGADGKVTVNISSTSAGPATVMASLPDNKGQISLPLTFVSTTPSSLVLQANPGAVFPNAAGSAANQSTLEATVRDASGNAVANRMVNFTIVNDDGNGGRLSAGSALTDANGRAQVQFIPGARPTKPDGVELRADVGSSVQGTTALTVNGEALNISIGFGNTIGNVDDTTYVKNFSVFVTDVQGTPVARQRIDLSTSPVVYLKGSLAWNGVVWAYSSAGVVTCPNEDLNRDGKLDPGEDRNGNGSLEPGNPIVVAPGFVTTDDAGRATFALTYGEQYAPWLNVELSARARVGGTESESSLRYFVSGLAADFNVETIAPAGVRSPFGTTLSCTIAE